MKIWAVIELEQSEAPIYWGYYDSFEKAERAKKEAEILSEWTDEFLFYFIIKEIVVR